MSTERLVFSKRTYQGMPLHFAPYKRDMIFYVRDVSNITGEKITDFIPAEKVLDVYNKCENKKVQVVNFIQLFCYMQRSRKDKAKELVMWIKDNVTPNNVIPDEDTKKCTEDSTEKIIETSTETNAKEYQEKTIKNTWNEKKEEIELLLFLLKKKRTLNSEARRRIVFRLYEIVMGERYPE